MSPDEELQKFREEYPARLELARKTALRFGILATIGLITCVYAFFQQTAGERQRQQYEINLRKMAELTKDAKKQAAEFRTLAMTVVARAKQISEPCQRENKKPK